MPKRLKGDNVSRVPFRSTVTSEYDAPHANTKRTPKPRLRHSTWLVTVNPNVPLDTPGNIADAVDAGLVRPQMGDPDIEVARRDLSDRLRLAIDTVFSEDNAPQILTFREPDQEWEADTIVSVDMDFAIELGSKHKKIHAHGLVKITHRSKIRLEYKLVEEAFKELLHIRSVHCYNRLVKGERQDITLQNYLEKTQPHRFIEQ